MVRIISQATYDEVVKENIEDLDMSPEEAIKDAIAQFEAQGVDLSNVIKDLALHDGKEEHIVCSAVTALKQMAHTWRDTRSELLEQLLILKTECSKDLARRVRAGKEGAYPVLLDVLEQSDGPEVTCKVLETLTALMDTQPDLLEDRGVDLMKNLVEQEDMGVKLQTLKWIATCCLRHEHNRQAVFKSGLVDKLIKLFKGRPQHEVLIEVMLCLRRLTLDDDVRVEFGKAHEHAREIAIHTIPTLVEVLKEEASDARVTCDAMLTLAMLLVRNELCAAAAEAGGCGALLDVCVRHGDRAPFAAQALKLIKALAGNDDVKRSLMKNGVAPILVSLLNTHMNEAKVCALCLWCVSALSLREPTHGETFVQHSLHSCVVCALEMHRDVAAVLKAACWAIRNIVSRNPKLREKFLELGIERLLNDAKERLGAEVEEEVKAALRDLGCEVKLTEPWRGTGRQVSN